MISDIRNRATAGRTVGPLVSLLGFGILASSCAQYQPHTGRGFPRPMATLGSVSAPVRGNGEAELQSLGTNPAELLRKGWILMETRRPVPAIHVLNRVLYSKPTPSQDATALALYLRSRAFQYRGEKDRALEDCRKARSLAHRTDLQRRCDLEISRLAPKAIVAKNKKTPTRGGAGRVSIIPRRRWNAARPVTRRLDRMGGIRRMTIHHSAILSRNPDTRAVATQIRAFQGTHIQENGWGDIGYHFLIDPAGRVWEGRDLRYQGAHAGGVNNEHNIGICLLGNFVPGRRGQSPSARQVAAMEDLVGWIGRRYSISRHGVLTHRELKPNTTCPGPRLQAIVNQMRRQLAMNVAPTTDLGVPAGSK